MPEGCSVCPSIVPAEDLSSFIHAHGRHHASGSDMTLAADGMCRTWAWLTSSPTHCCNGHKVSFTETLELVKHNVSVPRASLCPSVLVFGPLYGNVWQRDQLCVACMRMSSVSTEGSCKTKSSGAFIVLSPKRVVGSARALDSAHSRQLRAACGSLRGEQMLFFSHLWVLLAFGKVGVATPHREPLDLNEFRCCSFKLCPVNGPIVQEGRQDACPSSS